MLNTRTFGKLNAVKTFGNSMLPLLHNGDVVYLNKIKFSKIKVNDIVCVRKWGRVFAHRVVYRAEKYLVTRGDSNLKSDGKIYPKNIIGVVTKIKRGKHNFGINDLYLIQSTIYFKEIVRVKKAFEKAGVDHIFLKGLPLHLLYEGQHPRRIYADCDLLVNKNEFPRILKLLKTLGYAQVVFGKSLFLTKFKEKQTEVTMGRIIDKIPIFLDIHFEPVFMMTQLGELDAIYSRELMKKLTKRFFLETVDCKINAENFRILSPTIFFAYLALHFYHHNFKGVYRLDFMNNILKNEKIDFEILSKFINEFKLNNFIYPSFKLLSRYFKAEFPNGFLSSLSVKDFSKVDNLNIFDEEERVESGIKRFKNLFDFSHSPFLKKLTVFLDKQVIMAIVWVGIRKLKAQRMLR